MLKALFLDMDETLCDTSQANNVAKLELAKRARHVCGSSLDGDEFAERYIQGIYRQWTTAQEQRYIQIIEHVSEDAFRVQLIQDLLADMQQSTTTLQDTQLLQDCFDKERLAAFDFFPGIKQFLTEVKKRMTLIVITNGPEFSQVPKVQRINLGQYVDHIIIGGQEKEQKPAGSIFIKALKLAACENHEVLHIGDGLIPDIGGANASKIKSLWVRHHQSFDKTLGITPDYIIEHPEELPQFIKNHLNNV